ncbi:MAG: hypothetical protein EHM87_11595 [Burkholderiales bacterium]|nr:MAG: hypothetical protein EHM87_11595 [Burkholderiales bacterium]
MNHLYDAFPDTRAMPDAPIAGHPGESDRIFSASRRPGGDRPEPLTDRSLEVLGTLRDEAMTVEILADRFPHVLNRLSAVWDSPNAVFELIGELLIDRRGGRRGFPADALYELLALRRLCVRRIVASAGL